MKRKNKEKLKIYSVIVGSLAALGIFILFGIITVLVPNNFFKRMTPIYLYDYIFLILTALLLGTYTGLWYYSKRTSTNSSCAAACGAVGGIFSFGCALCNKLLMLLLGVTAVMTYFMPIQPILGAVSVVILSYAVYKQYKILSAGTGII